MPGDDVGDELGLSDASLLSEVGDGGGSGGGEAPGALDGDFAAGWCLACKDWWGWGYEALEDDVGEYGSGGGFEEFGSFDYAAFEVAGCVVANEAGFEVRVGAEFKECAVLVEEGGGVGAHAASSSLFSVAMWRRVATHWPISAGSLSA